MQNTLAEAPAGGRVALTTVEDEFDSLIRLNQRRIFRIIFMHVRDSDAADTLTQECFLRAFRRRRTFRGEASPTTWLIRIAVNLARDHVKNRRLAFWRRLVRTDRQPEPGPGGDSRPGPESILLQREDIDAIWGAVEHLPPKQKSVFLLRFGEDLSIEEIAESLALRPGTVKSHLSRALQGVRNRLGVEDEP